MLPVRIRREMVPIARRWSWLDNDFDRLVGRWFTDLDSETSGSYPVDIREDEGHVYIDAELPGFTKDQIKVTFEKCVLSIVAERNVEEAKGHQHLTERRIGRVARSFTLPNTVDNTQIDAKLENGVLHLILNKREEVKPRRIEVK